jgi:hypothetical protein
VSGFGKFLFAAPTALACCAKSPGAYFAMIIAAVPMSVNTKNATRDLRARSLCVY